LIEHAINELSKKNIPQEEKVLINSAARYLSELSKCENPRMVSKSVQRGLFDSSSTYIKKHGGKAFSQLINANFGQQSRKIQNFIQLQQDRGM